MERSKLKNKNYILPACITYSNMFFGLISIFISRAGGFKSIRTGAICILFAALTDKLDGYAARKLKATSSFGRELDSLSDIVSFGLAPIIVGFNINPYNLGSSYILASLIYMVAASFRLARFNIEAESDKIRGLPITLAGAILASKYLLDLSYRSSKLTGLAIQGENISLLLILAVLMVASFQFKKPNIIDKDLF